MPTSELSDALNPYASHPRQRQFQNFPTNYSNATQPPHNYVPHRSELELAIAERPPPPPSPPPPPPPRPVPSTESLNAVQELVRMLSETKKAQELEQERRLAWEQEQEAKAAQQQAEMQRELFELRQQIFSLKSVVKAPMLDISTSSTPPLPPASPISPVSLPSHTQQFIEGSSAHPLVNQQTHHEEQSHDTQIDIPDVTIHEPPPPSVTPSPSPGLVFVHATSSNPKPNPKPNPRKRPTPGPTSEEEEDSSGSDSTHSYSTRPFKRTSHHDKRCLTIQHAMRLHFLRLMDIENDKALPDSHTEGSTPDPSDPIRFVWDKTTKQSLHNARMKTKILTDIKDNRRLYKHVPDKEFNKKILDSAFEQCFTTYRQKFKSQRDALAAMNHKQREESKAQKSRRLARRKAKLSNRADARMKVGAFEHTTFDGALQLECMSSEESDFELDDGSPNTRRSGFLRTRGYAWRSSRLRKFYDTLDEEEKTDKSTRPKRGVGKKERFAGPPKDGFFTPPKGVSTWMISRRWIDETTLKHPDLPDMLKKLVDDPPGFDWDHFDALGDETDDLGDEFPMMDAHVGIQGPQQQQYMMSSSSLHYALS